MVNILAVILVDYENVFVSDGLKGIEYLNGNDTFIIFYSQKRNKINRYAQLSVLMAGLFCMEMYAWNRSVYLCTHNIY